MNSLITLKLIQKVSLIGTMRLLFRSSCRHYRLKNLFGRLRKSNWTENRPGYFNPSSVALSEKSLLNGLRCFNTPRKMSFCLTSYDQDVVLQIYDGNTGNFWRKLFIDPHKHLSRLLLNGKPLLTS